MKTTRLIAIAGSSIAFTVAGCDRGPELEPAEFATRAETADNAVEARSGGVRVVAQPRGWPGDAHIHEEVTPLRVIIENQSDQPVEIRYSDFDLKSKNGKEYSAIPPLLITGVVEEDTKYLEPAFGYEDFYVAPYYGAYYPGIRPYAGPFVYDTVYYDTYYDYWETTTALPTTEMLRRALPEGVVEAGGRVDGYLYFQRVPESHEGEHIWFVAELRASGQDSAESGTAGRGETIANLSLPFYVD